MLIEIAFFFACQASTRVVVGVAKIGLGPKAYASFQSQLGSHTIRLGTDHGGWMGTGVFRRNFKWSYSDGTLTFFYNDWQRNFPREQVTVEHDARGYYFDYSIVELRKT
jgi:hypothetical protein